MITFAYAEKSKEESKHRFILRRLIINSPFITSRTNLVHARPELCTSSPPGSSLTYMAKLPSDRFARAQIKPLETLLLRKKIMSGSIQEWFAALPPVTRGWLVSALFSTSAVVLGFASPVQLYLDWGLVVQKFQIWRLMTCYIFFGKFGLPFVFQLYFMIKYAAKYEENPFPVGPHIQGSSADFAFCLIYGALVMSAISFFMEFPFMGPALVFMTLYMWSRKNSTVPIGFFGFQFQGINLPWVMVAFSILMGNSPVFDLLGIAVGHSFFFLIDVVPREFPNWPKFLHLQTPKFLFHMIDGYGPQTRVGSAAPQATGGGWGSRHSWGGGRTLGGD